MLACNSRAAEPPITIGKADLDARVDIECVKKFGFNDPDAFKGSFQKRLRSEIEMYEALEKKHPGGRENGRKRTDIINDLDKIDRAMSQCTADMSLREEVATTMRTQIEKGRADFKEEFERGERYRRALEKCGRPISGRTEDDRQAELRCMKTYGF
jgi:hypothetical protein